MLEGKPSSGLALAVVPGNVVSAAVAGRTPRGPDNWCGLKAGWSSAISSERPSGENLPQNFLLRKGIEPKCMWVKRVAYVPATF